MADAKLQRKLADHVQDAHAMEQTVSTMLDSMISTTDDPEITEMLKQHKRQTREHERRLRERLDAMGAGASTTKSVGDWELRSSRAWATWRAPTSRPRTPATAT
jgi:ferritin-like metal-binding protein YciE